jgi:hypothetical protein
MIDTCVWCTFSAWIDVNDFCWRCTHRRMYEFSEPWWWSRATTPAGVRIAHLFWHWQKQAPYSTLTFECSVIKRRQIDYVLDALAALWNRISVDESCSASHSFHNEVAQCDRVDVCMLTELIFCDERARNEIWRRNETCAVRENVMKSMTTNFQPIIIRHRGT